MGTYINIYIWVLSTEITNKRSVWVICISALTGGFTAISSAAGTEERVGESACHCSKREKKKRKGKKKVLQKLLRHTEERR